MHAYLQVFGDAAFAQKLVFAMLVLASLAVVAVTVRRLASPPRAPPAFVSQLQVAAPALGLAAAALNARHMMETTLSMAADPSPRVLAPGFMEMAALVQAGAIAGLLAVAATVVLDVHRGAAKALPGA
jgi:hypothetical protein